MLLVEQNAAMALELADQAYLIETGRIVMSGTVPPRSRSDEAVRRSYLGLLTEDSRWKLSCNQVLAGIATGGIYASVALALVMIYQATHHVNFAQGEMAMFSTYIAWKLIAMGHALLAGLLRSRWRSPSSSACWSSASSCDRWTRRRCCHRGRLHRPAGHHQQLRRLHLRLHHQGVSEPVPLQPLLWRRADRRPPGRHDRRHLVVLALLYAVLPLHPARPGDARAAQNPESSRLVGIRVGWMLALGWGLAAAIGAVAGMMIAPVVYLDPNMMCGILLYGFAGALLGGIESPAAPCSAASSSACWRTWPAPNPMSAHELKLTVALVAHRRRAGGQAGRACSAAPS